MMTIHKLTAGDGYTYLTRQVAGGDVPRERGQSAAEYYTAQGNPPGRWIGRGAPLLGLDGQQVTEAQMKALFGLGMHPDLMRIEQEYLAEHARPGMSEAQIAQLAQRARIAASLGRAYPQYAPLKHFNTRVSARLEVIRAETGREPTDGERKHAELLEARRQRAAVAGYDVVFAPVKSAATLWAIDPRPHVRAAVRAAHDEARDAALALIEQHAAYTRAGAAGIAQIETRGLIAAAFDHYDSRGGDPNLHTHVAISNKIQGVDGIWRSLDARALYRITVAASELYNTAFETALSAKLGVRFEPRADTPRGTQPVREIAGIPLTFIEHFSSRRTQIEARYAQLTREYRREHGRDPSRAAAYQLARQANLDTRDGKKPARSLAQLRTDWTASLTAAFGRRAVHTVMNAVPKRPITVPEQPLDIRTLAARVVAAVAEQRSTWTTWNLRAEAERQVRTTHRFPTLQAHHDTVEQLVAEAVGPRHSIAITAPQHNDEPAALTRADGASVFTEHAAQRYTSTLILSAEARLLAAARTPDHAATNPALAAAALAAFEARDGRMLDPGQRNLVTAFATGNQLLAAGIGPAGSGKTTAMRALSAVLHADNRRLIPLATSSASADVLGKELGVHAENLHKFLHEHTRGQHAAQLAAGGKPPARLAGFALHPGDVILVDEAGMAGTLNLDRLLHLARASGASIRLLGDYRQLGAIDSGGALRLIAREAGAAELTTLYRFRNPAEADATLKIRLGDPSGLEFYARHQRIRSGSRDAMTEAAYQGWKTDMLAGKTSILPAASGIDTVRLSAQARADRVAAGQVHADGVRLHDGNLAGVGDWILTRENRRTLTVNRGRDFVKNGDGWQVLKQHRDGSLTVQHLEHLGRVRLPADYVATRVQLYYAVTVTRSQGTTVDTAHPLITAQMAREDLYVDLSRARHSTTLYVATHDTLPVDEDQRLNRVANDPRSYAALEILHQILATEGAERSATETIADTQTQAHSLAVLVPRYHHALDTARSDAYRQHIRRAFPDLADHITEHEAWPAVARALRRGEDTGRTPEFLLHAIKTRGPLQDAIEPATLLAWRINTYLDHHPSRTRRPADGSTALPGWISPLPASLRAADDAWNTYLTNRLDEIASRVNALAAQAAAERPAWTTHLGDAPQDPETRAAWTRALGNIAAYREQYQVTTNDPEQILGPYIPAHSAAHDTYWQAVDAVLDARCAAGFDHSQTVGSGGGTAATVYLALTESDRRTITTAMAEQLGQLWFGDRIDPDDRAALHPAHRRHLIEQLTAHGHLTPDRDEHHSNATAETRLAHHTGRNSPPPKPHQRPTRVQTHTAQRERDDPALEHRQPERSPAPTW